MFIMYLISHAYYPLVISQSYGKNITILNG